MASYHKPALYLALALLIASIALLVADLPRTAGRCSRGVRAGCVRCAWFGAVSRHIVQPADTCGRVAGHELPGALRELGRLRLSALIVPLLQIIMFGMARP